MVSCIVTTTGGVEEDIMKCMDPHYIGDFNMDGKMLRSKGLNRIGNLILPNENYEELEEWFVDVIKECFREQKEKGTIFSPSMIISRLGKHINDEKSIYYWCWKNDIPVFCPAFTDGALGDVIYFHSWKEPGFIVDIVKDLKLINDIALFAEKSGMIVLGGGVVKHHINNANKMRNGADFSVCINTSTEVDGSDAGGRPDEAQSRG